MKKLEYFHTVLFGNSWTKTNYNFKKFFETFFDINQVIEVLSIELEEEKFFIILEKFMDYRIIFIDEHMEKSILFDKLDLETALKKIQIIKNSI